MQGNRISINGQDIKKHAIALLQNAEAKIVQSTNSDKNARTHIRTQYSISDNQFDQKIKQKIQNQRIQLEIQGLEHQNDLKSKFLIQNIKTMFNYSESLYIQQPFICTLRDLDYQKIPYKQKLQIVTTLAYGLEKLQSQELCHKDLRPQNISVVAYSKKEIIVKINGFKYCASLKKGNNIRQIKPKINDYSAPETRTQNQYSYQSDIWSLGAIFFQLLFKDINRIKVINQKVEINYPEGAPQWMCDLFADILQRPPKKRHPIKSIIMLLKSAMNCCQATAKYLPNFFEQVVRERRRSFYPPKKQ